MRVRRRGARRRDQRDDVVEIRVVVDSRQPRLVRRARVNREYFILEKDGIPVAGIMNVDDLEDYLKLQDPGVKKQIEKRISSRRGARSGQISG